MELAARIAEHLQSHVFLEIEASGRHVHLTQADAQALFGHGLTPLRPLSQPGQFVCRERVQLLGPKGTFARVAVLGPERPETQVEISLTDAVQLGLTPPVRLSGDVQDSPGLTLEGDAGKITISQGVIVAKRHIHMTPEDAERRGVRDRDTVRLRVFTERPVVFEDTVVRVSRDFSTVVHLDYDEANACGFRKGDLGMIEHE